MPATVSARDNWGGIVTIADLNGWIERAIHDYTGLLLVAGGVIGLAGMLTLLIVAKVTHRKVKPWLIWLGSNLALLLNAEGMWHVATTTMHLSKDFAILIFAVFEILLLIAEDQASHRYHATAVRDEETGKLLKPGDPGKMLYVVWAVAIGSGTVVAWGAPTGQEKFLRILLPVLVVTMWWATLTSEGQAKGNRGKFAYTPMRLMERWGWFIPDNDPDYEALRRGRQIKSMVKYSWRLQTGTLATRYNRWRLTRAAMTADEAMVHEVNEQRARIKALVGQVVPDNRPGPERKKTVADASVPASESYVLTAVGVGDAVSGGRQIASADASARELTGPADAEALASTLPALTAVGVSEGVNGERQIASADASARAPRSVKAGAPVPRQTRGERGNGIPVLASTRSGRRTSITAPLAPTSANTSRSDADADAHAGAPARTRPRTRETAEEARQRWLASVADGQPLTGRQLGTEYGRSDSWGRTVIADARRIYEADATPDANRGEHADAAG
jgi:hypothetical protein